jgi:hypothetical protein
MRRTSLPSLLLSVLYAIVRLVYPRLRRYIVVWVGPICGWASVGWCGSVRIRALGTRWLPTTELLLCLRYLSICPAQVLWSMCLGPHRPA